VICPDEYIAKLENFVVRSYLGGVDMKELGLLVKRSPGGRYSQLRKRHL
jgi:hypothetical protein